MKHVSLNDSAKKLGVLISTAYKKIKRTSRYYSKDALKGQKFGYNEE